MFGGAGIRLPWRAREAVGLYPSAERLTLVHLCASETADDEWTAVGSCVSEIGASVTDVAAFASIVHTQLVQTGWEKLPLALALPASEADIIEELDLPVPLMGLELRAAILWALRAVQNDKGADLPESLQICCTPLSGHATPRYWAAGLDEARIGEYFTAFEHTGLRLRRLTICPPNGGMMATESAAAREPRMPWEMGASDESELLPAIYAGLLLRPGSPEELYWSSRRVAFGCVRAHAAALISTLAAALFLACVTTDIASYMSACYARDRAAEELNLRASEHVRMEEFSALHADAAQRGQIIAGLLTESRPLRALLVHLGSVTIDGVHILGIRAEGRDIRIEGEAMDYAALALFMGTLEKDAFFPTAMTLEDAGQGRAAEHAPMHIQFVLHGTW